MFCFILPFDVGIWNKYLDVAVKMKSGLGNKGIVRRNEDLDIAVKIENEVQKIRLSKGAKHGMKT